ncbi:MAG: hypothetical protein K9L74_05650 [Candidatus Izimaplasma sp.]|nr:hypothetical protein [Candidatus Izimaplasma bacterium]
MKVKELLNENLIEMIDEDHYKCLHCGKIYSKIGVSNHHFYNHEIEGMKKREELKKIATENNNKPEMKKKISEGTIKAFDEHGVREKLNLIFSSEEYKQKCSVRSKKLWEDEDYRKKTTEGIKKSRTEEFSDMMSKIMKEVQNRPNSISKSKEFSELQSKIVKGHWEDEEQYKKRCKRILESWIDEDRRYNQSEMAKKLWEDPNHILKVLEGKLKSEEENGSKSYGKIGRTDGGSIYESTIEKEVFEFLENNNIKFEPHKQIPESRKISDLVIDNVWIELDGLGRDYEKHPQHKRLMEKISHYNNLKHRKIISDFKTFKNFNEFLNWFYGKE